MRLGSRAPAEIQDHGLFVFARVLLWYDFSTGCRLWQKGKREKGKREKGKWKGERGKWKKGE